MILILLSVLSSVVYGQTKSFIDLPNNNPEYPVNIGEKYFSEVKCLKNLDALLKVKWLGEMKKIPTMDLGDLGKIGWEAKGSSYTRYDTLEEEWLMNDNVPTKRIDQCFRNIVSEVVPLMSQNEIDCLNELFSTHVVRELDNEEEFESLLKTTAGEQLPFRKFISFIELVEILFQNRNPDTLTDLERVLYEHAESYLITDEDRARRTYVGSQDCDWVNAKNLRELSSQSAKFKEFTSQVRRSVNKQLAGQLVKTWNLNSTISGNTYERWLNARQDMLTKLEKEVEKLRKQKKDAQWLCEYATKLALKFSDEQLSILMTEDKSKVHLEVSDVASKARAVEKALEKLRDFRHSAIKTIADKYEEGTTCMFAFLHLVQNHRRYDIASAFIDERYSYPEIYCTGRSQNFGLVQITFCNCIGSFCIAHPLAALFANEYVIAQRSDGTYHVVRSGSKSKRKIIHCHTLANGNYIF